MANRDGTGPNRMGPGSGRGLGPCGAGSNRGFGRGQGFGRRNPVGFTKEEEKEEIDRILKVYENEIEQLKKRLEELK